MFFLVFLVLIVFAALSATIAANKNRSVLGWALIGFFFSLFGFLAALMVSEVEEEDETSNSGKEHFPTTKGFDPDEHEKKCPMCAEYIKLEARRCKHCGHEFSEEEVERQIEEVKEKFREKKEMRAKKPAEPREKKDPSELETPPPDEIAARCGDCHYPLRSGQRRCPKCQKEVEWS